MLVVAWSRCVCAGKVMLPLLPVTSPFDPQYVLNTRLLSSFAVIAEPAALRHLHIQTFLMESSRTGFTAQQTAPFKITVKHRLGYFHY